jgi:hypothetical protein
MQLIQEFSIATRIAWRRRMTPVHFCRFEHPTVLHVGLRARWPILEATLPSLQASVLREVLAISMGPLGCRMKSSKSCSRQP